LAFHSLTVFRFLYVRASDIGPLLGLLSDKEIRSGMEKH
jgi:hypothetical protein